MHASLQCYPSTFLRPHHWREMVPGTSVAIHVRAGLLILRIFCPPNPELMNDRHDYFMACDEVERNKSTCLIVELVPGQLMSVFSKVGLWYTDVMRLQHRCTGNYF